jgi:hypothetical protein
MMNRYDINTRKDLWKFYGGQEAAGERFGICQAAIGMYSKRGIKPGWYGVMMLDLLVEGKTWNPEIFDLEDHPGAALLNSLILDNCRRAEGPAE